MSVINLYCIVENGINFNEKKQGFITNKIDEVMSFLKKGYEVYKFSSDDQIVAAKIQSLKILELEENSTKI